MTRWFRVYDDLIDDPKVQRLDPTLFKTLINLWCLASANEGVIPAIDEIPFKLRMKPEKAQRMLSELRAAGLIDDDERRARPHNWDSRQFISDGSTSRVKRFRERHRNVSPAVLERHRNVSPAVLERHRNVSPAVFGTTPETETETETERKTPSQGSMNSTDEAPARVPPTNGRAA
jgi:hypothetical protein